MKIKKCFHGDIDFEIFDNFNDKLALPIFNLRNEFFYDIFKKIKESIFINYSG